jgi:hypothetical protein
MTNNKHNLPQVLVNLFGKRQYSRGASRWSVSNLIAPPKITVLREAYAEEIAARHDISDSFWSLMGSNIHRILEDGADDDHVVEQRIFTEIAGFKISGQIDVQQLTGDTVRLIDWKFTSVWSVTNPKEDWENQLNLYAYLIHKEKGMRVEGIWVCAILKDWKKMDVMRRTNYPEAPIVMVRQPLWSFEKQEAYALERTQALAHATAAFDIGTSLPDCTDEDRWLRDGENKRCENFCEVADWCDQWKALKVAKEAAPPVPKKTRKKKETTDV